MPFITSLSSTSAPSYISVLQIVVITPDANSVSENTSVSFSLSTVGIPDGTTLYWRVQSETTISYQLDDDGDYGEQRLRLGTTGQEADSSLDIPISKGTTTVTSNSASFSVSVDKGGEYNYFSSSPGYAVWQSVNASDLNPSLENAYYFKDKFKVIVSSTEDGPALDITETYVNINNKYGFWLLKQYISNGYTHDLPWFNPTYGAVGLGNSTHGGNGTQITKTFTIPENVTSISVCVVGGGGGGGAGKNSSGRYLGGGCGGGLAYRNNISVTPGDTITAVAGSGGSGGRVAQSSWATTSAGQAGGTGANSSITVGGTTTTATGGAGTSYAYFTGSFPNYSPVVYPTGTTGCGGPAGTYTGGGYGGLGGGGYGGGGGGGGGFSGQGGRGERWFGVTTLDNTSNSVSTDGSGGGGGGGGIAHYSGTTSKRDSKATAGGWGGGAGSYDSGIEPNGSSSAYNISKRSYYTDGFSSYSHGQNGYPNNGLAASFNSLTAQIGAGGGGAQVNNKSGSGAYTYGNNGMPGMVLVIWPGSERQFPASVWPLSL